MPAKGRRMASRQAELGRRRKRHNRPVAAVASPSGVQTSGAASPAATAEPPAETDNRPAVQTQPGPVAAPQRTPSRTRLDRPAAYNYIAPELRRISIMAGVLLAGLIALSFAI